MHRFDADFSSYHCRAPNKASIAIDEATTIDHFGMGRPARRSTRAPIRPKPKSVTHTTGISMQFLPHINQRQVSFILTVLL
jgi:hypothetical protein